MGSNLEDLTQRTLSSQRKQKNPNSLRAWRTWRGIFLFFAFPFLLVLAWWLLTAFHLVNPYLIPSPGRVVKAALAMWQSGELGASVLVSLGRVWAGYAIAVAIALPLALAFHVWPLLKRLFRAPLELIRAIPPLAMIPLLILWFGIGEASKLAVIILASFFPIFLDAENGFDSMDAKWLELSKTLELSFSRHLSQVLLPAAFPQVVTGLRLGFGYAWRALLGAELFSSASGLGYLITDAQEMARVDKVFVGILAIGVLGLIFDGVLRFFCAKVYVYE
jgi:NitT/TauT family transport system permease protein/sulfonate transport system permease protein